MNDYDKEEEKWKPIRGYNGRYEISNWGSVKSLPKMQRGANGIKRYYKGGILRQSKSGRGYLSVMLYAKKGGIKRLLTHRIVGLHFLKKRHKKFEINHKDGDKCNNYYLNLEWISRGGNLIHAVQTGLRQKLPDSLIREIYLSKEQRTKLSERLKISQSTIYSIRGKKTWVHITFDLNR